MPPSFYLLHGPDEFGMAEFIEGLQAKLGDPTFASLNTTQLDGRSGALTLAEARAACDTLPFLSEHRLVVIESWLTRLLSRTEAAGDDDADPGPDEAPEAPRPASGSLSPKETMAALVAYLPQLPPSTKLVMLEKRDLPEKNVVLKAATGADWALVKHFDLKKGEDLTRWIRNRAKQAGGEFTREAAEALGEVEGDPRALEQEITKLLTYVAFARAVELDDVQTLTPTGGEAAPLHGRGHEVLLRRRRADGEDGAFRPMKRFGQGGLRPTLLGDELARGRARARQHAAVAVRDEQRIVGGKVGLPRQLIEPTQLDRHEGHAAWGSVRVADRVRQVEHWPADESDDVGARLDLRRTERAFERDVRLQVRRKLDGGGAAQDLALRRRHSDVGELRQPAEQRRQVVGAARGWGLRLSPTSGNGSQATEQRPSAFELVRMLPRSQAAQVQRLGPHPSQGGNSLFGRDEEDEEDSGYGREADEQNEATPERQEEVDEPPRGRRPLRAGLFVHRLVDPADEDSP